jgi:site-specific recombinase XerD
MSYRKDLKKLEDSAIWRGADKIAQKVFEIFDQLPEEEKALLKWKFCNRAFDLTSDIAEACGTFVPKDAEYSLSMARRALFSIKNTYLYLAKRGIIEIDPQFVVDIDKLVADIDAEVRNVWKNIDDIDEKDAQKKANV